MSDALEPLILDLLEWIGKESCAYSEVIEVWRTSCPRLPVWEKANARGFVDRQHRAGNEASVVVSPVGRAHLLACRSASSLASTKPAPDQASDGARDKRRSDLPPVAV